jgi:hypothetical protein
MGAHKKQEAKTSLQVTSGLANLAVLPRDNVESGSNEKL